jgi:hypothetical protein
VLQRWHTEQTKTVSSSDSGRWTATTTPIIGYGQSPLDTEFQAGMTYNGSQYNSPVFTADIFENWLPGDFNFDGRVNSTDFYILRYWYVHSQTEAPDIVDLNNDGQLTLADFSYLSYYWTG